MKATGIVRTVDHAGRMVIPKEIRRTLGISIGDPVEFYVEGDSVIMKKYKAVGDIDQVLDDLVKTLELKSPFMDAKQFDALMAKIRDMRDIVSVDED